MIATMTQYEKLKSNLNSKLPCLPRTESLTQQLHSEPDERQRPTCSAPPPKFQCCNDVGSLRTGMTSCLSHHLNIDIRGRLLGVRGPVGSKILSSVVTLPFVGQVSLNTSASVRATERSVSVGNVHRVCACITSLRINKRMDTYTYP